MGELSKNSYVYKAFFGLGYRVYGLVWVFTRASGGWLCISSQSAVDLFYIQYVLESSGEGLMNPQHPREVN